MNKTFLLLISAILIVSAASCDQQPGALQFKTIEVEDFVKHPAGTEDFHGLKYKVSFTYPARYTDKAVLKTLQQRFVRTMQSWYFQNPDDDEPENYDSLPPEKAVKAIINTWKAKYSEAIKEEADDPKPEWATAWELRYSNTIPFVNEKLLQLQTETYQHVGGAHGATWFTCHLFNLQTGEEYSRDDIFKPESSARIHRLLVAALLNYWEVKSPRDVLLMEEEVWTENTDFSLTTEGIAFVYSDYELGSYALGCAQVTIPYDKIMPYLREGTPVWDVANANRDGASPVSTMIDETEFTLLVDEIFHKLPASFMPDFLKTAAQRRDTQTLEIERPSVNTWSVLRFDGGGGYDKWTLAAYLTDDMRNIVLIVQYGGGLDGYSLLSDKTLNYDIATGSFTEIERPVDPFSVDELLNKDHFETEEAYNEAKAFLSTNLVLYYREFMKEGFCVMADLWEFWLDRDDREFDAEFTEVCRKWNGSRFVKP